ncbi:MAG: helix-turn-helix domain-containing protein [Deltaproteobacteria bacterium]|nr:helix-turn-helix domain-containing protein [Deltaproteobacteria bacterium]
MLPTGTVHVVFRGDGAPLRLFDGLGDPVGYTVGHAMVGGPRAGYYVRDISDPADSVGAVLEPGVAPLLFGVSAEALADRHVALEALWGADADRARTQILSARSPEARLIALEQILRARLPMVRGVHPAIAAGLGQLRAGAAVAEAALASGYSHRRFIALFREAIGLTPKTYARVQRFGRVLGRLAADPRTPWLDLALDAGYSDQPHFVHEFRAFTGVTPNAYRALPIRDAHHVPILEPAPEPVSASAAPRSRPPRG